MKTISELNEKMWYRALKVVYLFFVGVCYLIATGTIVGAGYEIYDNHQDYLIENRRYQPSFKREDFDELQTAKEREIAKYGIVQGKSREEIISALNTFRAEVNLQATSTEQEQQNDTVNKVSDLNKYKVIGHSDNVLFQDAPKSPHTLLWSLGMLLLIPWCYFCAWLATMIPRWIFYYVVLGTVRPPK